MNWAIEAAKKIKDRGKPLEWVDDMKTPSGRIHVGALRGVLIHDEVYKKLLEEGVKAKYTYIFDDFDPMDSLPTYLPQEKFEQYMGSPLNSIPSPNEDPKLNYAQFYALEFKEVFNSLGADPDILWQGDMYKSGQLNEVIKTALDNSEKIQDIYQKISGSQKKEQGWLPFAPLCENCGKIGTTRATKWDGKEVEYECVENLVTWAKGCGYKGSMSPFNGNGKLPWKVEWPAVWAAIGITVEGAGKDHSSKGGSRDIAKHLCEEVFKVESPYDLPYEFFIVEGAKMSSSKGVGVSAKDASVMLPKEVLRFLIVRPRLNQVIDFDPTDKDFIFRLFDEFDREQSYFMPRFSLLISWVQMPNVDAFKEAEKVKGSSLTEEEKKNLEERIGYVKIWLENYAPENVKFSIKKEVPKETENLSEKQKELLKKIAALLEESSTNSDVAEDFQNKIYQLGKDLDLSSQDTFKAIYVALIGREYGPKAGWLILSLDKDFVKERFNLMESQNSKVKGQKYR